MLDHLRSVIVPTAIGVLFFLFGFFTAAQFLGLAEREIVIGLIAGLACGVTTLAATLIGSRASPKQSPLRSY